MKKKAISVILLIAIIFSSQSIFAASAASGVQTMANIVVFVRYSDESENTFAVAENYTNINAVFNDTSNLSSNIKKLDYSFKNYIHSASRGKVQVNNYFPQEVTGAYNVLTLAHTHDYYTDDVYIISEVFAAFANGTLTLPADKLDNVESSVLDCLMIITQGDSDAFPDDEVLYPHKAVYGASEKLANRLFVRNYVMIDSDSILNGQRQGVISHEFMHVIGYPDLYRYSGGGNPVYIWDLMAAVSPYQQYPLSYMRSLFGWVPLNEITQSGTYTLNAATSETGTVVYKIQTPMSGSEFFALEYRVRNTESIPMPGFDSKVYSGLLVYRVNDAVEGKTNSQGNDYIYVFRPGETSLTDSAGDILGAAINPAEGETSYGSADFDATFSDNTIFYSNGKNSGITISNITAAPDNSSITFDITFPDYSTLDLWDSQGTPFGSGFIGDPDITVADNGDIYAAATKFGDFNSYAEVWKYSGGAWAKLGGSIDSSMDCKISAFGNDVYIFYCDGNGVPTVKKLSGTSWATVATLSDISWPGSMDIFTDEQDIYISCIKDGNCIDIKKVLSNGVEDVDDSLAAPESFSTARLMSFGGKIYAVYSYFGWNISEKRTMISEYNPISGIWTQAQILPIEGANIYRAEVSGGKLWVIAGATGKAPVLASFDGTSWVQEAVSLPSLSYSGLSISVFNNVPYVAYLSNTSLNIVKKVDGAWESMKEITTDCAGFDFLISSGVIYAASVNSANGNATVFRREIPLPRPEMSITAPTNSIYSGSTLQLTAVFNPASAASAVTWVSADPLAASVDANGVVTAHRPGKSVRITATDAGGNSAIFYVSIKSTSPLLRIYSISGKLEQKVNWWRSYSDATLNLGYSATDCGNAVRFTWTSDSGRVKVDSRGNVTNTGSFARRAKITLTAYDAQGGVVASTSVTVRFYKFEWQLARLSSQAYSSGGSELSTAQAETADYLLSLMGFVLGKVYNA